MDELLLAVTHADNILFKMLEAETVSPSNNVGKIQAECIKLALEIVLNVHKRGGISQGQMKQLELLELKCVRFSK